ncbi:MAG TPA: radical SAM protein [Myxococcota bacterium]|nr:radical SAM protein [Myxococcota bacterium]HQK50209.1 radical SAM protein [Myxococcota bacterium]
MDDPAGAPDPRSPRERYLATWRAHAERLDQKAREHPLRYLFLEVTRRCNLACAYCGSSCTGDGPRQELDAGEWVAVVDQVAQDFDPRTVMVAVTGGEPLLKPDILRVFEALRDRGFAYGMVTNGLLLDAAWARALVRVGMGSVSVSLDGPPEVNDAQRGPGAFEKASRAIRLLQEAGFQGKLEALSTLTRPAIPHLDRMRGLLAGMRVPLWRVAPVMPIGRARERPDLVPGPAEVRALLEWVLRARQDPRLPVPEHSEEGFLGWRFEGRVRPYLAQCRAGVEVAGVMADGRIGACPELPPAFHQGDIRRERLRDVWEQRFQVFRDRSWTRKGPCATCDHWAWCRGGALHLYPAPGGDFARCLYLQAKEAETLPPDPHPKSA